MAMRGSRSSYGLADPRVIHMYALDGARVVKVALTSCAGNEDPDQTAHLRSLIWAFIARLQNQWIL